MPPSDSDSALTQGETYDLLSNPRRRYVLYYLSRENNSVDIGTLADQVAAWENDTSVEEVESQERKRVYVSLYQTHIPKLEEAGLVDYDQDEGTVSLTNRVTELTAHIESDESQRPWPLYYLAIAVVGGALYLGATLGLPLLGLVPELLIVGLVVLGLVAVAAAHYLSERHARRRLPPEMIEK